MKRSRNSRWIIPCLVVGAYSSCVSAPTNERLTRFDAKSGYRINNVVEDLAKETYVILTFSGGGTRAAALSYGILEKLRATNIANGEGRRDNPSFL